jgi:hypothetical protein
MANGLLIYLVFNRNIFSIGFLFDNCVEKKGKEKLASILNLFLIDKIAEFKFHF